MYTLDTQHRYCFLAYATVKHLPWVIISSWPGLQKDPNVQHQVGEAHLHLETSFHDSFLKFKLCSNKSAASNNYTCCF